MKSALIGGFVIAACVAILFTDYVVVRRSAPRDDNLIKELQNQVKSNAAQAPKLAAEQNRITAARRARKTRDNAVAWVLILSAAVFFIARGAGTPACRPALLPARRAALASCAGRSARAAGTSACAPDLTFIDQLIAQHGRTQESAIILLQSIQTHYRYLPDEALRRLCELTEITPAQVAGTSSFYGQFRRSPVGRHVVRVCHGTACHVSGARQVTDELRRYLAIPEGADTDPDRMFTVDEVACLGCCSLAPVLMVDNHAAGNLTPATACEALQAFEPAETA
ncbi:MAG: NAD(P)H-dependent oxidoreductase subunit E [Bryobacteraceae bacterium]|jgi:NADH:ubiquinone oxidoreductase subunit E